MEIHSFLGRGWAFPPSFDKAGRTLLMSYAIEDIEESIRIILGTTPGERMMQPGFGCNLKKLVFEKADSTLIAEINHLIYHALLEYEPRVIYIDTDVVYRNDMEGFLQLRLHYQVISTNTRHNMVYPFYFLEGTNITSPNLLHEQ